MDIERSGSQPSGKGPPEWFTGTARIDPRLPVLAIQEAFDGKSVEWLEKVSDEQYGAGAAEELARR